MRQTPEDPGAMSCSEHDRLYNAACVECAYLLLLRTWQRSPHFAPIDMTRSSGHDHPDIVADNTTQYLVKFSNDPSYYLGSFDRQWYGLNFNGWGSNGRQFDAPGTNSSKWERVWRLDP